jgi:hypothetical protein
MGLFTEDEKRASDLLDKAIESSKQADQIRHKVVNGVMHKGRRRKLAEEVARLDELAQGYSGMAEAIWDRLEDEDRVAGRPVWTPC